MTEVWMAPAGSEFIGKGAGGEMLCASEDGVQPALDLMGTLEPTIEFGLPEVRDDRDD